MGKLSKFWEMVNEPIRRRPGYVARPRALGRLFHRFFLAPHGTRLAVILLGSMACGLTIYFYAWCGRFVADEVVQVHLLKHDAPEAETLDPTLPGERRLFAFDEPRARSSITDRFDERPGRTIYQKMSLLGRLALLLVLIVATERIFQWIVHAQIINVGVKAQFRMRNRIYDKLQALPMSYHDRHSVGYLMTHLFSDVSGIRKACIQLFHSIPVCALQILVGMAILMSIDARLACLMLLAYPAYGVCYRWFRKRLKTIHHNLREREGRLNAHLNNRVKNFYLVKSYVNETTEAIDFVRQARPIMQRHLAASILQAAFAALCGIISGVCMVAVLWLGALRVRDGIMTTGTLLMFYAAAGHMFTPVASLTQLAGMLHRLRAMSSKVMQVLDMPLTLTEPAQPVALPPGAPRITFDNVSFRYNDEDQPVLRDLSFEIPAGKKLCVMGASGAGKSSLAKLACRIYDTSEGKVLYDGQDIREFKIADLRRAVGFVPQEPIIFDGTIAENIRYGSEHAYPSAVAAAAGLAQIKDFVESMPEQYETQTQERGLNLSGGQKQRVNLARALLYEPQILVLDDCTSALDAHTEAMMIKSFKTALDGRTGMLVSHRVSIAMECDLVLMLDAGQLAEFGPPDELLQREGMFSKLYHEQVSAWVAHRSA